MMSSGWKFEVIQKTLLEEDNKLLILRILKYDKKIKSILS